jgi:transposase InsO family protein
MPPIANSPMVAIAASSRQATAWDRQSSRRQAEQAAHRRFVQLCETLSQGPRSRQAVARRLSVPRRTLSRWRQACVTEQPRRSRGRPCKQSPVAARQAVLDWLDCQGTHLGSPSLRTAFPNMPRCELLELQRLWRRDYREQHRTIAYRLTWHEPGRVWAMDHTHPPEPIDDRLPAILCVRDLASGMLLAWQPVPDETAATTIAVVKSLFAEHGPPLVIKSDNGSAFKDADFAALLCDNGVTWLPSPPRRPSYNGSCEATNRQNKIRTEHFAAHNFGGRWTTAAIAQAQHQANELLRPQGHLQPSPAQRWAARTPISDDERATLLRSVAENFEYILEVTKRKPCAKVRFVRRVLRAAVRQALLECGLLSITPRFITLPFKLKKRARFS